MALIGCAALLASTFLAGQNLPHPGKQKLSSYDAQVNPLVSRMTLEEKIGQMTQPDQQYLKDGADIEKLFLGSVLSGGDSDPAAGNSLAAWTSLYDRLQSRALKTRLRIPLLYGVDALHGHSNVLGAVIFPHNIGLGCTRNPGLVEKIARVTAEEVRATGINWTFAPCVTVPQDIRWGRTYEGFSEDPETSAMLGAAAVRGYQGASLNDRLAILASAKHYVGDGGTTYGTGNGGGIDQGDMRLDEATMRRVHLPPYRAAIDAGVGSIMVSYNSWNGEKNSGSRHLLTDLLKGELGFEGLLISDYNAIDQITPNYAEAVVQSISAGMDMIMVPERYREFIGDLKAAVVEGKVPMARIDDAVTRILRVKFAMGLMDEGRSPLADRSLHQSFGSAEHRAVARQAVRESLVLLKNDRGTLPLSKRAAHIHVAGKSADDLGNQCGGWTIQWQGHSGDVTSGGTTILAAIRNTVAQGTKVTFSKDGTIGAERSDLGVVVIGETPYAEGKGDNKDLNLSMEDVRAVKAMKRAGIPVVVVLLSGRPMILSDILDSADAILAAWLPGTEGAGVADILFGDYKPTGKLSFSWPRSMAQIADRSANNPLFPVGYGLTY
jgi:beta-glucosidase